MTHQKFDIWFIKEENWTARPTKARVKGLMEHTFNFTHYSIKNDHNFTDSFNISIFQLLAAPFAAGALNLVRLLLPPPWAYISLIPSNIIGKYQYPVFCTSRKYEWMLLICLYLVVWGRRLFWWSAVRKTSCSCWGHKKSGRVTKVHVQFGTCNQDICHPDITHFCS